MSIDRQIDILHSEIIVMARNAEEIYQRALATLERRDEALVEEVLALDQKLDQMEMKIDLKSMRLLALNEPYALDFRFVFSVIKTTRDLERVGDESKTIAKWSRRLGNGPLPDDLHALAIESKRALTAAVEALVENDVALAEKVFDIELKVDEIEDRIIATEPELPYALIARAMERVGDSATNISENVIFSVRAEDIRHGHGQSQS